MNLQLANRLGLSDKTIEEIKYLHSYRESLDQRRVNKELSKDEYWDLWTKNEFALQELWGFPRDADYHTFWRSPHCTCPKMDNDERIGYKDKIVNLSCPLHGE